MYFSFLVERKVQRNVTFKSNAPINTNLNKGEYTNCKSTPAVSALWQVTAGVLYQ